MQVALTIAGSDSSGGAGIQGDLKTFQSLGLYGVSVITAITVQNTQKVYSIEEINPYIIRDQILCLFEDLPIKVVKIGMVSNSEIAKIIADTLSLVNSSPIIFDPVMISKSGYLLSGDLSTKTMVEKLIPMSYVITPNLYEAEILSGCSIKGLEDMKEAAIKIHRMGSKNIVIKGGHLEIEKKLAIDLGFDGKEFKLFKSQRINTINTHGTGCTFSSSLAAYNILEHNNFFRACLRAKGYISKAITNSLDLGKGCGPTNHCF